MDRARSSIRHGSLRLTIAHIVACLLFVPLSTTAKNIPGWLDTIPPRVEIMPKTVYHASVFMITLSANKRATFYVGINTRSRFQEYTTPISIARDTTMTMYFYGEDDLGNKSKIDSMRYVLDTRLPRLNVAPNPGFYGNGVVVRFTTDKPCRFEFVKDPADSRGSRIADSVEVTGVFEGFVAAIDSAGNRAVSGLLKYVVDTSTFTVTASPSGGLFNKPQPVTFNAPPGVKVFYTFDPLAPPEWFRKNEGTVLIPAGLSVLRYYGRDSHGRTSKIEKEKFILDMVAPKVHLRVGDGTAADTLYVSIKKHGVIYYSLDGSVPTKESPRYVCNIDKPEQSRGITIVVPHKGKGMLKALAWDEAGNQSDVLDWERKYDFTPPLVSIVPAGGVFTKPPVAFIGADKPSRIFYTLDGSRPDENGMLYNAKGIALSREGVTEIRYCAIDEAGNKADGKAAKFFVDTKPPEVRVKITGTLHDKNFLVQLLPNEPATIFYEVGGGSPNPRSPTFKDPIPLLSGQALAYYAVDTLGNAGKIVVMDELKKPMVSAAPEGGMFNKKLWVKFLTNVSGAVYWRMLPDTVFKPFRDSIPLRDEGLHTIEYYLEADNGLRSVMRRSDYLLDWTPPRVGIRVKKGLKDSVTVFFEASENASIYYTTDGSSPLFSPTVRMIGNKYLLSKDRISIVRSDAKLAFYAEDAAGNQSSMTVLDVLKPRVVPNVPAGPDRIFDRILSITLDAFDQSIIYYARHGKTPTADSAVYSSPITLIQSDTIVAFAVDASGFRGDLGTFVYLIDLPPSPHFTFSPDTIFVSTQVAFDPSTTVDKESPLPKLQFRWDFDGDGVFDTKPTGSQRVAHTYTRPGRYHPALEVTDENKRVSTLARDLLVVDRCPAGMISVVDSAGNNFCIDKYEWPNEAGKNPLTGVSWVEAKMACIDAGKRLCSQAEWKAVCNAGRHNVYPYGDAYESSRCPTEGVKVWKSGSFKRCNSSGVYDMIGNAWEWVEDKQGDYPVMMGGSIKDGKDAHCGLSMPSTLAARADDIGFRCCK
jgi:hypothetical protein